MEEIARVHYGVLAIAWRAEDGAVHVRLEDAAGVREMDVSHDAVLECDFGGLGAAVGTCPVYALLHDRGRSASVGLDVDTDRGELSPEELRERLDDWLGALADAADCHAVRVRPPGGGFVEVRTHSPFSCAISPTAERLATVAFGEGERVNLWNPVHAGWQGRLDVPGARALAFVSDRELVVGCQNGDVVTLRYGRSHTWTERARKHDPTHAVFAPQPDERRSADGRWSIKVTSRTVRSYLVG